MQAHIFESKDELFKTLSAEFEALGQSLGSHLVSLASGSTFADFYSSLGASSPLFGGPLLCTHLDEYEGFRLDQQGGMAWELLDRCAALGPLQRQQRFIAFPHTVQGLAAHGRWIEQQGGIGLQLLGIGRNGHLGFNEPGSARDSRCRRVWLHPWTLADMGSRFGPGGTPTQALTSGLAEILAAERVVLVARGRHKSEAVRRMLSEPMDEACPASFLQEHPNLSVLLDREAAALL